MRGILFCVLLVAGAQLAYATHLIEHSLIEVGETCEVCLQLERTDDALSDVQSGGSAFDKQSPIVAWEFTPQPVFDAPPYQPRSPPTYS